MGTPWHIGDFGRFNIENPQFPRFEVISWTKTEVQVWYSGHPSPTAIPKQTFRDDCVRSWLIEPIEKPFPKWLYEGSSFTLESPFPINVVLAQVSGVSPLYGPQFVSQGLDLNRRWLTYRRKQGDYISCLTRDPVSLVLVPIKTVMAFGQAMRTRWDFIRTGDIVDPYEDDF